MKNKTKTVLNSCSPSKISLHSQLKTRFSKLKFKCRGGGGGGGKQPGQFVQFK